MKVLVIGGTGSIGKAVVQALYRENVEVIIAGHSSGDIKLDITKSESIKQMYEKVGPVDAVICAVGGNIPIKPVTEITKDDYIQGIQEKLLGQIDVVLIGIKYLNEKGSFTVTTGVLNKELIPGGSCLAMINSALESFVESASLEMPKGLRLNAVSPTLLESSQQKYSSTLKGFQSVPDSLVALSYLKCVYGIINGKVLKIH